MFKSRTSDALAQRRGQRQFETIGEKVGESLLPLFESEGARLDEGDRTAVAIAVAEAFNKSKLSSELLAQRNLEPTELARHVLTTQPTATRDFSAAGTALYQRIIQESCAYIVDIASQLPAFTEHTFAEVLKREDQLINKAELILQEVRQIRESLGSTDTAHFEEDYCKTVVRKLDELQLFGTDVSSANRRHRLSVAYITLSVEQMPPLMPENGHVAQFGAVKARERPQDEVVGSNVSVDVALARSRYLLIRGDAGSGKTTLLQWIAVKSALSAFDRQLVDWNSTLPFYIRLRQCVQSGLPQPEAFPGLVAPEIAATMPNGWVHAQLKSGRAIVLVDGLDEVSVSQREDVRVWLKGLMGTFPKARFIVTSRPYAAKEGWLDPEGFSDALLQPMELADIYSFIDHWHQAVREELHEEEEKTELAPLAEHLKADVQRNRSIRNLATNPLLCAMLCALNRDRRQHLPADRIELYEACCLLLLERRDKERRVDLTDYPALNYRQKRLLLEDLAYWMIKNNWSQVALELVDERFERKLKDMPGIVQNISGSGVRRLFVERSGIIREPVTGQIDFTHRTFEEFLAAKAAVDEMDVGLLKTNAHNDQWREVIILASGLATKQMREELIKGLITRGDEEKEHRYQLHLLAVSCLETAIELEPQVKAEVEKRLSKLVPPRNVTDAKALAAAGELAVKYLAKKARYTGVVCAACVRALATIGGDAALETLEGYASDGRGIVVKELVKAWDAFDRGDYARRVLSPMLQMNPNPYLERLSSLDGSQYLTDVTQLRLYDCRQINDLTPLAGLTNLTSLELLSLPQISDLAPLAGLVGLMSLGLSHCSQISDLTPLASITNLTTLDLNGCPQVSDLTPLVGLINLTTLWLSGYSRLSDLAPLVGSTNLTRLYLYDGSSRSIWNRDYNYSTNSILLDLRGCPQPWDLTALASLTNLTSLFIDDCPQLTDLTPLAGLTNVTQLKLYDCRQINDLTPLAGLTNLTSLKLERCSLINDLTPLAGLTNLTSLFIDGCSQLTDLKPLAGLTNLTRLYLHNCPQLNDLTPLASLARLKRVRVSASVDGLIIPQSIMGKM